MNSVFFLVSDMISLIALLTPIWLPVVLFVRHKANLKTEKKARLRSGIVA